MEIDNLIKMDEKKYGYKAIDIVENNPWSVDDASDFLKYCCPECDYQILNYDMFSSHALQTHEMSRVLFGTKNSGTRNEKK